MGLERGDAEVEAHARGVRRVGHGVMLALGAIEAQELVRVRVRVRVKGSGEGFG